MRGADWYAVAACFFFLSRRLVKKMANTIAPRTATPATTPPAMAPTGTLLFWLSDGGIGVGEPFVGEVGRFVVPVPVRVLAPVVLAVVEAGVLAS